jgi:large subunit ribosomal protein L7/L12
MNEKINQVIEILKTLTLLDVAQLVTEIKQIFNINLDNIIDTNNSKNLNEDTSLNELKNEKTSFSISLIEIPLDKKIAVLKLVRTITGLGLKESKDIVDNIPKILKENITKDEVDKIKTELETLGAKVQIL